MKDINVTLTALYIISVVSLLITPGPVTLLVIRAGLAGGMRHAFQTICGTNAASLIMICVSALLIKGLLVIDERVFLIVRMVGCLYIVWIAYKMVNEIHDISASSNISSEQNLTRATAHAGFLRGFSLAISNPKDIIFFASFLPQFIGVLPTANQSIGFLTVLWIVLDFTTLGLLTFVVRHIVNPTLERMFLLISSILLFLIGIGGFVHAAYKLLIY